MSQLLKRFRLISRKYDERRRFCIGGKEVGNEEVLDRLISEYSSRLIKYCYSILGNYHDAEDAVQDTFLKLYYRLGKIQNEEAVAAYMYRVAYTIGIDILRNRKRHHELQDRYGRYIEGMPGTYEMDASCGCISEPLYMALMQLKPADRALVHAVAVEQLSYREVSVILQKSEAALRKRYERAMKKVRQYLEEREGDM